MGALVGRSEQPAGAINIGPDDATTTPRLKATRIM